jgi:hypothetical protein
MDATFGPERNPNRCCCSGGRPVWSRRRAWRSPAAASNARASGRSSPEAGSGGDRLIQFTGLRMVMDF